MEAESFCLFVKWTVLLNRQMVPCIPWHNECCLSAQLTVVHFYFYVYSKRIAQSAKNTFVV